MASGLLALLDDVAVIAKMAAASVDDVVAASARATTKAAGVVIDDTAVTPRYVAGFRPERELPLVWQIAKGSLRNKLLLLMPAFLLLAAFLPALLTPLLMLGGAYLCFESAEKLLEKLGLVSPHAAQEAGETPTADHEQRMVAGAVRTDLILSAEILAIALGELGRYGLFMKAAALGVVSVAVTAGVYGFVAMLVKMDDIGVRLAATGTGAGRAAGTAIVTAMPRVMKFLSGLGIAAMAWVGGGIIVHGLEKAGPLAALPHAVHAAAGAATHAAAHAIGGALPGLQGPIGWTVSAILSGLFGLLLGSALAGLVMLWQRRSHKAAAH